MGYTALRTSRSLLLLEERTTAAVPSRPNRSKKKLSLKRNTAAVSYASEQALFPQMSE